MIDSSHSMPAQDFSGIPQGLLLRMVLFIISNIDLLDTLSTNSMNVLEDLKTQSTNVWDFWKDVDTVATWVD